MNYPQSVIFSQKDLINKYQTDYGLIVKAKHGPSKETNIPLILNRPLSFFVGAIIGDGHLRKDKKQITIELSNRNLIYLIKDLCKDLFNRSFNINSRIKNNKSFFYLLMDSKAIYNLLNKVFEIPTGKKSNIVKVPSCIIGANNSIKTSFLLGILFTEGGNRKRGFGLTTASYDLWRGLIKLFNDLKINVLEDKWFHKKYKKYYYGISFKKEYLFDLDAEMPEWSNGLRLGDILSNYD